MLFLLALALVLVINLVAATTPSIVATPFANATNLVSEVNHFYAVAIDCDLVVVGTYFNDLVYVLNCCGLFFLLQLRHPFSSSWS